MKLNSNTVDIYLFEAVERITRFYSHLDGIRDQFYSNGKSADKLAFIEEYKTYLIKLLEIICKLAKVSDSSLNEDELNLIMLQIKGVITVIADLHLDGLYFLPRPSEPVELERFKRRIDKNLLNRDEKGITAKKISFFPSEKIGEETYLKTAIFRFEPTINEAVKHYDAAMSSHEKINEAFNEKKIQQKINELRSQSTTNSIHITIPRIDSENPCRWPTLIHEIAHHIHYNEKTLDDFKKHNDKFSSSYLSTVFQSDDKLKSWLNECWCDIFAALVMGPAFWLSQYAAFLFAASKWPINSFDPINKDLEAYPPAFFRLNLIYAIWQHRGDLIADPIFYKIIEEHKSLFKWLFTVDIKEQRGNIHKNDIDGVYLVFKEFFLTVFYKKILLTVNIKN